MNSMVSLLRTGFKIFFIICGIGIFFADTANYSIIFAVLFLIALVLYFFAICYLKKHDFIHDEIQASPLNSK